MQLLAKRNSAAFLELYTVHDIIHGARKGILSFVPTQVSFNHLATYSARGLCFKITDKLNTQNFTCSINLSSHFQISYFRKVTYNNTENKVT